MSAKLLATQLAGVTLGVVGAGLFVHALDKTSKVHQARNIHVFDKLPRIKGEYPTLSEMSTLRSMPVFEPVDPILESRVVVFDDNFATEAFEDY